MMYVWYGMYVYMYVCMYVCQSVPEATKESVVLEEVVIEALTERRRMAVEERKELPVSCAQCGRQFSQPRYMQRHKCVTTRKKG